MSLEAAIFEDLVTEALGFTWRLAMISRLKRQKFNGSKQYTYTLYINGNFRCGSPAERWE